MAHVFDVTQTDGEPLPEFATVQGDPGRNLERLKAAVRKAAIEIDYDFIPGGALGISSIGRITLSPELEPAAEFAILVHEFAHEILHRGNERSNGKKSVLETEAEAVAFIVCRAIGLDTNTASSDYIQLYRGTKETLGQSLERIQQTAARILADVKPDHTAGF